MKQHVSAVIGANFGDEGKGRTVDWLVNQARDTPLVVRHNSSAQAGHTVVIKDKRHVFSHFGSGTLRGARTLLAHKFVLNPVIFNDEYDQLVKLGVRPRVFVDARCIITTPLDALINQVTERLRGDGRHGSCGIGFGETIQRAIDAPDLNLYVNSRQLPAKALRAYTLRTMEDRDLPIERLEDEGLIEVLNDLVDEKFNWENYTKHFDLFYKRVVILDPEQIKSMIAKTSDVIFEGAQGLLLHESHEYFPHVTRCRTGLEDVADFLTEIECQTPLHPYFCTRSYMTRHGAGPLVGEQTEEQMRDLGYDPIDLTNRPGEFQGSLRYAPLDYASLMFRIGGDVGRASNIYQNIRYPTLAFNCFDQASIHARAAALAHLRSSALDFTLGWGPDSAETEDLKRRANMGGQPENDPVQPAAPAEEETTTTETEAEQAEAGE